MSLDDVAEINRLTDLITAISSQPSSLREDEVHNIRGIMSRTKKSSFGGASMGKTSETEQGHRALEQVYDDNQIRQIQAKINSIRGAALAQDEDITDDGPGDQEVL